LYIAFKIFIMKNLLWLSILFFISSSANSQSQKVIDFVSDTQQPMTIEKIKLHSNHNEKATAMILSDIIKNRPLAVYMLGDVVAVGSSNGKWKNIDKFIDSCRDNHIIVHALLGNHDVMWSRKKGEKNFQKRFPDHIDIGYACVTDSVAIVMLNSNFKKLSSDEIKKQQLWYSKTLKNLNDSDSVKTIIVCCHHAPYSNSKIVGSSKSVQQYFVPDFIQTKKCKLFITGHAHAFEHFNRLGKDFLTIGGGGGLHQPLDTSAKRIPDIAFHYKPMFHYLSIERIGNKLLLTSHFIREDFSGIENGYSFEID
jgi:hypothetical protein